MELVKATAILDSLVSKSSGYGFEEAAAKYSAETSKKISILFGEVSSFEESSEQGISFRGLKNGQMGKCSTNIFDSETEDFLLSSALENCEVLNDEDPDFIYCDPDNSDLSYEQDVSAAEALSYDDLASLGLSLEKKLLESDERIVAVDHLSLAASSDVTVVRNSKGLKMFSRTGIITVFAYVRAQDGQLVKTAGDYWYGLDLKDFDVDKMVEKIKNDAIAKLSAKSVKSSAYTCIYKNEAFMDLVDAFMTNFSSSSMQHGLSLLAGREGEKIASDIFTLTEIPEYEKAVTQVPFDAEGVLTTKKALIENGIFKTAMYNLKTANKAGCKSTGNAMSAGQVDYSNLVVTPGDKSLDELAAEIGSGIIITEISGLHAGLDTISGDFSLLAEGFLVEDGKIGRAVDQITVADNFYDTLMKITAIGSDVKAQPGGAGEFFSPSVVVRDVSISGELN